MSSVSFFSIILGIGASLGLFWILLSVPAAQRLQWLLAAWVAFIGALIGARGGYVLEHFPYFSAHTSEMAQFWLGGLTWEGALAGGLLTLPLIARLWQWPFFLVLDCLSRLLLPLGLAGWAGLWWSGLGYGVSLGNGIWWGMMTRDESGTFSLRTPLQPLALLGLIVFLGVLDLWLNRREITGLRGLMTFFIFSASMLMFSFLRADPAAGWLGLRFETWLAMVFTLLGASGTIIVFLKNNEALPLHQPFDAKKQERKPL
jgi:prolipoprotein diacylglyceryltransferase